MTGRADAWQLDEFLNAVAAREPTPGGGAVAATAGALGAALARMVAAYSISPKVAPDVVEQVHVFGFAAELLELQPADGGLHLRHAPIGSYGFVQPPEAERVFPFVDRFVTLTMILDRPGPPPEVLVI